MKLVTILFCVYIVTINNVYATEEYEEEEPIDLVDDHGGKRTDIRGHRVQQYYEEPLTNQTIFGKIPTKAPKETTHSEEFSYDESSEYGPSNWKKISPTCEGNRQSPIDINSKLANLSAQKHLKLKLTKWTEKPTKIVMKNEGHNVNMRITYKKDKHPTLSGGPLPKKWQYALHEIHWHFGLNSNTGSEHQINSIGYAAESHCVFYNKKYGSFQNAIQYPDGLAVVGQAYEERNDKRVNYPHIQYLQDIVGFEQNVTLTRKTFNLRSVLSVWRFKYYTYKGGLTTPPCSEVVTWIFGAKPLPISSQQLQQFRALKAGNGSPMAPNARPTQNLAQRPVIMILK